MSPTEQLDKNVIPPMTHPYSKHWKQPPAEMILIDDTHALMNKRVFDQLAEYSASQPSGVYEGKMWKRHDGAFDREFLARGGKPEWYLCWYGYDNDPNMVSNNYRKILIVD